jgi:hypothetical protein
MRATTSEGPPAGKGTTIVIGRDGYASCATLDVLAKVAKSTAATVNLFM